MLRVFLFWLKMDLEVERISRGGPDLAMEAVNSLLGAATHLDKLPLMVDEAPILFFYFFFGHTTWLVGPQSSDQGLNPGPSVVKA